MTVMRLNGRSSAPMAPRTGSTVPTTTAHQHGEVPQASQRQAAADHDKGRDEGVVDQHVAPRGAVELGVHHGGADDPGLARSVGKDAIASRMPSISRMR